MSEKQNVEVTFKLPKRLLDFLENENYLEWDKDHFFVAATISFISCNINDMDFDKAEEIHRKYGEDVGTVYPKITKTLA